MDFLRSFCCEIIVAQLLDGLFDCDVIMQKITNRCDIWCLAKGHFLIRDTKYNLMKVRKTMYYD